MPGRVGGGHDPAGPSGQDFRRRRASAGSATQVHSGRPSRTEAACWPPEPLGYHPRVAGLSRSEVEHVAYLARLGMTPEELDRLQGQLNHILDQYMKLAELDTDAI